MADPTSSAAPNRDHGGPLGPRLASLGDNLSGANDPGTGPSSSRAINVDEAGDDDEESDDESDDTEGEDETEDPYKDDPVIAEYKVYLIEPEHPTYVLQYLDRPANQPVGEKYGAKVLEMRVKPETGFFEVDVALNIHNHFDRTKAVKYGEALKKTKALGQQSYGISAGFERIMPRIKRRRNAAMQNEDGEDDADGEDDDADEDDDDDDEGQAKNKKPTAIVNDEDMEKYVNNFEDANEKGHVLNYITYGGRVEKQVEGDPIYMCGVFRGDECHMHQIAGFVRLSTEYHHFDAIDHLEAIDKRKQSGSTAQPQEPKAVAATSVEDEDFFEEEETFSDFLKRAASEPWQKLTYHDQDSPEAWHAFNERVFLHDTENAVKLIPSMDSKEFAESLSAVKGVKTHTAEEDDELFGPEEADEWEDVEDDDEDEDDDEVEDDGGEQEEVVGPSVDTNFRRTLHKDGTWTRNVALRPKGQRN